MNTALLTENDVSLATGYIDDVLADRIVVGKLVRQAVERHVADIEHGTERGLYFDEEAAARVIRFFNLLKHSKGRQWAGQTFILSPWQAFILYCVFGWKRADGTRRFRTATVRIGRKNGKSTLSAGVGLYLLLGDQEPGAEVYSAATKRDQAKIVFSEAKNMIRQSKDLSKYVQLYINNIVVPSTGSKFEPLSSDAHSLDGLNVSGAIIDEFHAHKTREVWDVINTATGSRTQPLLFVITTAGHDLECACYEQDQYAKQILAGSIQDDSLFAYLADIDEEDDWKDPNCWIKANPNLGVSVTLESLEEHAEKAKKMPSELNAFLTKRLNKWVQQAECWILLDLWDEQAGVVREEALLHRPCSGAIDLSTVSDLTAWLIAFPRDYDPEEIDILCRFWCPESRLYDDKNQYRYQYQKWREQGYLIATPGNAIDYDAVMLGVKQDVEKFDFRDIHVDVAFQGYRFCQELMELYSGIEIIGMRTNMPTMTPLCDTLEMYLLKKKVHHGGNPILRWMAGNVALKKDATGQLKKPIRQNEQAKIDGIISLLMALDGVMRYIVEPVSEIRVI